MKQRLLAVDDEPHMLLLLERIITEKTPYAVVTANSALEVPALLGREQFDLIITDLKMPGLDGLDLLRWVRSNDRFEQVVIITAFGSLESAVEALSQGVFDYITKPFKKEQIIFTVDRAMRWQALRRQVLRFDGFLACEPYAEAEAAFQREYVKRLAGRYNDDLALMAQHSGLTAESLRALTEAPKDNA
jgi:DNA-binding NtrC family response regulator